MKKRGFLTLAALLPLCFSCGVDFSPTDDPSYPYLHRNGDKRGQSYASLREATTPLTLELLSSRIERGYATLFFLTQDGCPGCASSEHSFLSYIKQSEVEAFDVYQDASTKGALFTFLTSMVETYPEYSKTIPSVSKITTPSIFIASSDTKIIHIPASNNFENANAFTNQMKDLANYSYVYEFSSFASFSSFYKGEGCLLCLEEKENPFYSGKVEPYARSSSKKTAHVYLPSLSETEKKLFLDFANGKDTLEIEKGGKILTSFDSEIDGDSAEKFAKSYLKSLL